VSGLFPPLREELRGIEPYGAPQLSLEQAPVQLNVNENPYGPSPEAAADIARAVGAAAVSLNRYPDREFVELRTALAAYLDTSGGSGITP
jgi:histidinol-phosphate aminotransferase